MQKQLRIGILLFVLLLVVETVRLIIAAQERIDIQILAVEPPINKVLEEALGATQTRQPPATPAKPSASLATASQPGSSLQVSTAGPARPDSKPTLYPSPEPTASPTPTLLPYRTVIPENKPERQATALVTQAATPAESNPEAPTNPPLVDTPSVPTNPSLVTPTVAPADLPTSAPDEPPTPQLPTEAP